MHFQLDTNNVHVCVCVRVCDRKRDRERIKGPEHQIAKTGHF